MGKLFIVSTPIGNLDDITIRAIKTLFEVDIILCEDTRRTGLLLQQLKNRYGSIDNFSAAANKLSMLIKYDDRTEQNTSSEMIQMLESGKHIALVSDAGTPLISDPGFRLVREAIKRGIEVVSIPGASALLTALTSSGLPAQPFLFLGFPPEKQSHRIKLFQSLSEIFIRRPLAESRGRLDKSPTIILYCAPHKLQQTLTDMKEVFGDIDVVVARELTKIHEEMWRGKLSDALTYFQHPKGEFVLLFYATQG